MVVNRTLNARLQRRIQKAVSEFLCEETECEPQVMSVTNDDSSSTRFKFPNDETGIAGVVITATVVGE